MARRFLSLFCPGIAATRLNQLVEWCGQYSPLTAADGNDGVILDITGCAHLFGGEGPLLLDLRRRLHRMGIESRAAIADAWGAAWALARYGNRFIVHGENAASAIAYLPVEALRLPDEIVAELRRLGLTTIAALRKIPRKSLAARFGSIFLRRLDQTFNQADEPLTPWLAAGAASRASRIARRADLDHRRGGIRAAGTASGGLYAPRKRSPGFAAYGLCLLPGGWNSGPVRASHRRNPHVPFLI